MSRNELNAKIAQFDAVVVGAGFGGMYMMHKLRDELGLNVLGYDAAEDVGGTWYWNRYPGARSDTESFVYSFSFDDTMLQQWEWSDRYPKQPEILNYLNYVADHLDLRRSFQFATKMVAATFNEETNFWQIENNRGDTVHAQFLITALGLLSATNMPSFNGLETFSGEQYHTGNWPTDKVDFAGKRVGVIGTGSTGVQCVTDLAPVCEHLTVFQRSPQYSVPARHGPMPEKFIAKVKANYQEVWEQVRQSIVAFGFKESEISLDSVNEEEQQRIFEDAWEKGGGFRFMFGTFDDITTNLDSNEAAAAFIRNKISQIVEDPDTAKKLTPHDLYAKRPLCDAGYYESFNRDNVSLVDIKSDPIDEVIPSGIRTQSAQYDVDVLIFATGFDAVDGSYTKLDIRGRDGQSMQDKWAKGPTSYLGMANANFPNMFMVLGPNGPFTNLPPSIETQVEWISGAIGHLKSNDLSTMEATIDSEQNWSDTCDELANMTLFPKAESWIFGANIPGKANTVMFYMAGIKSYRLELESVRDEGYRGFTINEPLRNSA